MPKRRGLGGAPEAVFSTGKMTQLRRYFSQRPEIAAVFLFGSLARGEARPDSDLDLGVLLTRGGVEARVNRPQLVLDMMSIWERPDVDVVILNGAPPLLLHRVVRDGHVLYAVNMEVIAEFTIRAFQEYEDTRPLRNLQAARLQRQLAALRPRRGEQP
jgi:predicted nucleotidyltransferase